MSAFGVSFAVYTLLIVLIGLYSARFARRSDEDFFLAGRSLGPWVAALSASASSESGWVTLGLIGWAFTSGVSAYWIIPGCLAGFIFNWFVIAGRLWQNGENYDNEVYVLPKHLDEKVARMHLDRVGARLTELSNEQADYIGVPREGPFKPEHYRY